MTTCRSVCLLCRSFLLRDQPSVSCSLSPPRLSHTTLEILQLSKLARSVFVSRRKTVDCVDASERTHDMYDHARTHEGKTIQTREISRRLSKAALRRLPTFRFPGEIVHIRNPVMEEKHSETIRRLLRNKVVGFDVECLLTCSRPILVQLASREVCVMWQLNQRTPFPTLLHGILSSPHYLKVGHGAIADARALLSYYGVNIVNMFDTHEFLTSLPPHLRPPLLSLQGLVGVFLGHWLSKSMTRSNWNRRQLSRKQLLYASTDVWASLEVYLTLMRYASEVEVIPPPALECTLRMCKPHLIPSLEDTLKNNIMQAEQARIAVEKLAGSSSNLQSPSQLSLGTDSELECALNRTKRSSEFM